METTKELLETYIKKIEETIDLFQIKFGVKNPIGMWRNNLIERVGFLTTDDGEIEYSFHGSGCTVETPDGEVISFDFLENDIVHFDLFKFQLFAESVLGESADLDKEFKNLKLVKNGKSWELKIKSINSWIICLNRVILSISWHCLFQSLKTYYSLLFLLKKLKNRVISLYTRLFFDPLKRTYFKKTPKASTESGIPQRQVYRPETKSSKNLTTVDAKSYITIIGQAVGKIVDLSWDISLINHQEAV